MKKKRCVIHGKSRIKLIGIIAGIVGIVVLVNLPSGLTCSLENNCISLGTYTGKELQDRGVREEIAKNLNTAMLVITPDLSSAEFVGENAESLKLISYERIGNFSQKSVYQNVSSATATIDQIILTRNFLTQ